MTQILNNNEHTVRVSGYSSSGAGISRLENGCVCFIDGAVRGDLCRVSVKKLMPRSCHAVIDELIEPSAHRKTPDCPVFGQCGGCDYRHISYDEELFAKCKRVEDALKRLGGIETGEIEIFSTGQVNGYRNKAVFSVTDKCGRAVIGFKGSKSHEVVETDNCALLQAPACEAAVCVRDWMNIHGVPAYDEHTGKGLIRQIYTRKGDGDFMVCLVINGSCIPGGSELVEALKKNCEGFSGLVLNKTGNKRSQKGVFKSLWGKDFVEYKLEDLSFQLSASSFFQINRAGAIMLYKSAGEFAQLENYESLWDLYCGTGTMTMLLGRRAKNALGVDCVASAIENARQSAARNEIKNVDFLLSDASVPFLKGRADCVIVDPPRAGLSSAVIRCLFESQPARVIYISCNPATLARDIKLLKGYELSRLRVIDMFPRTSHVETVVLLSKLKSASTFEVKIDLDEMDLTKSESKATYDEIKQYVSDKFGFKVSQLYIAQVKRKHGIIERSNYNIGEDKSKVPQVPPDEEKAIEDALKHFQMI